MSNLFFRTLLALPLLLLSPARAAPAAGTIVVAASLPLTGEEAKAGDRVREGYQYAFDEAARAGGLLVGGRRVPLTLRVVDDGTNKEKAAALARSLVERDGADFLLGSFSTPIVEAQAAVADQLKVPYVTSSGSAASIYRHGYRYVFSVSAPTEQLAATLMRWIDDQQRMGKLRSPLRPAPGGSPEPSFGRKLFIEAQASIRVPSTEKCSSDSNLLTRGWDRTAAINLAATSPASNRSRFLVNTVTSQIAASIDSPTNQRNSRL